jgi:hypothetical protein
MSVRPSSVSKRYSFLDRKPVQFAPPPRELVATPRVLLLALGHQVTSHEPRHPAGRQVITETRVAVMSPVRNRSPSDE